MMSHSLTELESGQRCVNFQDSDPLPFLIVSGKFPWGWYCPRQCLLCQRHALTIWWWFLNWLSRIVYISTLSNAMSIRGPSMHQRRRKLAQIQNLWLKGVRYESPHQKERFYCLVFQPARIFRTMQRDRFKCHYLSTGGKWDFSQPALEILFSVWGISKLLKWTALSVLGSHAIFNCLLLSSRAWLTEQKQELTLTLIPNSVDISLIFVRFF